MSQSFASLMALSATQTQASQILADAMVAERQRKREEEQKRHAEQERKQRERDTALRAQHFERQKKDEERKRRQEEEGKKLELVAEKRRAAQRDLLLHGPLNKRGSHKSASSSQARRTTPSDDNDNNHSNSGMVLTREELRERKLQEEMRSPLKKTKRSAIPEKHQKQRRITSASSSSQSLKGPLASAPLRLFKLNTVKRDTRSIDEIVQDRAKERKILRGGDALAFDDWFGNKKTNSQSRPSIGTPEAVGNTLKSSSTAPYMDGGLSKKAVTAKPQPKPITKPSAHRSSPRPFESPEKHRLSQAFSRPTPSSSSSRPTASLPKKRARSPGSSHSPRSKRRAVSEDLDDGALDVKGIIWGIMGKKRNDYVNMDVHSDDEDMEADARALECEERESARIAKREELAALEDERRHQEKKKRQRSRA